MKIQRHLLVHYGLTIFLSAFLLFQVQPLIGKMILPWFGGSASVWTTCMLFFQLVLLLGYFYSHWVVRSLRPSQQSLVHGALLLVSVLWLPVSPSGDWKPLGDENPTLRILGLLTVSIGLPYFVLSTTGPLLQAWFARERFDMAPYRLFALSNLGSMLALLAYPLAIEPVLATRWQSLFWSGLYACFVLACVALAWRGRRGVPLAAPTHAQVAGPAPGLRDTLLWVALAACPSILMVADTSFMTTHVAPIPMLWVLPLALYLLSFILGFERQGWYPRRVYLPLLVLGLLALAYLPTLGINDLPLMLSLGINLAAFFVACMVCHGELARLQPDPRYLTTYYLMLSVGGVLGGFFVGVVAPYGFNSHYELSIGVVLTGLVAALAVLRHLPAGVSLRLRRWGVAGVTVWLLAMTGIRIADHVDELEGALYNGRNFYGTLQVHDSVDDGYRTMLHGQITHGRQWTQPGKAHLPTAYYTPESGVGMAWTALSRRTGPMKVGVIGLGVGTLATYGRPGDTYRLYEIDPLVLDVAKAHFSFLRDTAAQTEMVLGDARLRLEAEPAQQFDLLVVDAFSGDSVPVHLLTIEAFAQYFRHLKPDGVLAVHITNRFLDLRPVVQTAAAHFGKTVRLSETPGNWTQLILSSRWALLSADAAMWQSPALQTLQPLDSYTGFRPWRDDYGSIFSVLK